MSAPRHLGSKPMEFPYTVGYAELHEICVNWHSGQWSPMYSVSSTGTIHDIHVLRNLSVELGQSVRAAERTGMSMIEIAILQEWEKWCDGQIDMIGEL